MTSVRRIPVTDHLWLLAALKDALQGGPPVYPTASPDAPEPPALPEGTAVVIHTSGSSGTPKFVAHSAASIRASASATNEALGGDGQWLITLPTHLIAGFQMLTRSILSGTEPVFLSGKLTPKKFRTHARELTGERRYVSLIPAQLNTLLDAAASDPELSETLTQFQAVLVGGQHVPLQLRQRAFHAGVKLVRTYGMTETGGGVVYDGVEIGDTRVRIRDGEIQLAGGSLALGYAGDPALTSTHFITDEGERWYRTGDAGTLLGGMLQVTGRLDRVIISGGVNVSLDRLETRITEEAPWSAYTSACVATPHTQWGERPTLVVESPTPEDDATLQAAFPKLQALLKHELGPAWAPCCLNTVTSMPKLANHKIDYQQLHTLTTHPVAEEPTP